MWALLNARRRECSLSLTRLNSQTVMWALRVLKGRAPLQVRSNVIRLTSSYRSWLLWLSETFTRWSELMSFSTGVQPTRDISAAETVCIYSLTVEIAQQLFNDHVTDIRRSTDLLIWEVLLSLVTVWQHTQLRCYWTAYKVKKNRGAQVYKTAHGHTETDTEDHEDTEMYTEDRHHTYHEYALLLIVSCLL